MGDLEKEASDVRKERESVLAGKMERKEAAVERMISMIFAVFKASNKEIPVIKLRLKKGYSPAISVCSVAFSIDSDEYYFRSCVDPYNFATSENVLKCGSKQIKDVPEIIDKMLYFENTLFPEDILDRVYDSLMNLEIPGYFVKRVENGIEVILN